MGLHCSFKVFFILFLQFFPVLMIHLSDSSESAPEYSPQRYDSQVKCSNLSNVFVEWERNFTNLSNEFSQLSDKSSKWSDDLSMFFSEMSSRIAQFSSESSEIDSELSRNISKLSADVSKLLQHQSAQSHEPSTLLSKKYHSSQLYVFGGRESSKSEILAFASHFNSSTQKWEATTRMSVAKCDSCGVAIESKVYLFGGINIAKSRLETAEVYECETGTYSQYRSLPGPRGQCGAAVLDGFIYVAGGWDGSKRLSSVIRYNIQTTRRESVSSLHIPRYGHQLVELGGRLYAIGGHTRTVEAYNPSTDRWITVASTHFEHNHFGAVVHEGKIYAYSYAGFEVYSPDVDQWKTLTSLSKPGKALVSMNGKLWALGGEGTKSVSTYDTVAGMWSEQPDMDVARSYHTAVVVNH